LVHAAVTAIPGTTAPGLYVATFMTHASSLTALNPAFACPALKASVTHAMEGSILPAFRYSKFFSLGLCTECAGPFTWFLGMLNPFTYRSYLGDIRFFPDVFSALNPFVFSSNPGHPRWFPGVDGIS
jgi:hypothetical protein